MRSEILVCKPVCERYLHTFVQLAGMGYKVVYLAGEADFWSPLGCYFGATFLYTVGANFARIGQDQTVSTTKLVLLEKQTGLLTCDDV